MDRTVKMQVGRSTGASNYADSEEKRRISEAPIKSFRAKPTSLFLFGQRESSRPLFRRL
jgi:hypothetical protein